MPAERYYAQHPLKLGDLISLEETEFHHLVNVMRAKEGGSVEIVNGEGVLAEGLIVRLEKKKAIIQVSASTTVPPPPLIILAQAIPRLNRLDFILEKGTELGMSALWLFPGELSERKELTAHQIDRLRHITIAAMKQSGRLHLPQITVKPSLKEWKEAPSPLYYGDPGAGSIPFKELLKQPPPQSPILLIGPESGLSANEENILKGWEACPVLLHRNVLRTDTAALAFLTLASQWS